MSASAGSTLEAITTCELCKEKLHLNIENFDINELYRSHERVRGASLPSRLPFVIMSIYTEISLKDYYICIYNFFNVYDLVGVRVHQLWPLPGGSAAPV